MRVGTLCYATDQGLGVLAKSFHSAGIVTDPAVLIHPHRKTRTEWYPGARSGRLTSASKLGRDLAERVDVMLFFETPFEWSLIPHCRERGVKTVLMVMHECMPKRLPYQPDAILCPSLLDLRCYPEGTFLPVPVAVPWKQRERAHVYVHNAGNLGLCKRNGTGELIDAMRYVKSPLKLILRTQKPLPWNVDDPRIEVRTGSAPYDSLFTEGDVFVFPEKFNGLSLPLQEARAAGMLVMSTRRYPMTEWLPTEPLIPIDEEVPGCVANSCRAIDVALLDPVAIAAKMDEYYGADIAEYSLAGRAWAEANSWDVLGPRYVQYLENVCASST